MGWKAPSYTQGDEVFNAFAKRKGIGRQLEQVYQNIVVLAKRKTESYSGLRGSRMVSEHSRGWARSIVSCPLCDSPEAMAPRCSTAMIIL